MPVAGSMAQPAPAGALRADPLPSTPQSAAFILGRTEGAARGLLAGYDALVWFVRNRPRKDVFEKPPKEAVRIRILCISLLA